MEKELDLREDFEGYETLVIKSTHEQGSKCSHLS